MTFLQETLRTTKDLVTDRGTDIATSGTLSDVATAGTSFLRFTGATAINSFAGGVTGKHLLVTNANSVDISIVNDSGGTAANRILTGTGGNITLGPAASLFLVYDDSASRWRVVGGVANGFSVASTASVTSGGTIALGAGFFQVIPVAGSGGAQTASTTPFGGTPPLNGTVIRLLGTDLTNVVTIPFNDASNGCLLAGDAALGRGSVLELQYISALSRYVEISRNQILGV